MHTRHSHKSRDREDTVKLLNTTAAAAMTHIAIQEEVDGKSVDWMEQVSDEQYGR